MGILETRTMSDDHSPRSVSPIQNRCPAFDCVPLTLENAASAAHLLAAQFSVTGGEPLAIARQITYEEMLPFTLELTKRSAAQGLSAVCKDSTGKVLAVVTAEDLLNPVMCENDAFFETWQSAHKFEPIFELLAGLEAEFIQSSPGKLEQGSVLHQGLAAVHPELALYGLASYAAKMTIKLARAQGYKMAVAQVTGKFSQSGAKKMGYQCRLASLPYDKIKYRGDTPFRCIPELTGHTHCELICLNLQPTSKL